MNILKWYLEQLIEVSTAEGRRNRYHRARLKATNSLPPIFKQHMNSQPTINQSQYQQQPSFYNQQTYGGPGQFQPMNMQQTGQFSGGRWFRTKSKRTKIGCGCSTVIAVILFFAFISSAIGNTQVVSQPSSTPTSSIAQATIATPTVTYNAAQTPTPIPTHQATPVPEGPDRQTVQDTLYNATYSENIKIDSYSQRDAVLHVSDTLGTEVGGDVPKIEIFRIEKAFYTSNFYMSSVSVTINGTFHDQNGNIQSTGPFAKATLTIATASGINWTFSTSDSIWQNYDYKWLSPSLN